MTGVRDADTTWVEDDRRLIQEGPADSLIVRLYAFNVLKLVPIEMDTQSWFRAEPASPPDAIEALIQKTTDGMHLVEEKRFGQSVRKIWSHHANLNPKTMSLRKLPPVLVINVDTSHKVFIAALRFHVNYLRMWAFVLTMLLIIVTFIAIIGGLVYLFWGEDSSGFQHVGSLVFIYSLWMTATVSAYKETKDLRQPKHYEAICETMIRLGTSLSDAGWTRSGETSLQPYR